MQSLQFLPGFGNYNGWGCPRARGWLDHTCAQHLLHFGPDDIPFVSPYSPVLISISTPTAFPSFTLNAVLNSAMMSLS